jgi:NADH-quinone oxidoreductase subunit E
MSGDIVLEIIKKWNNDPDFIIEMLQDVQSEFHYVSPDAINIFSDLLNIPHSKLFHILTFFKTFSLEPKGKHHIQVCMGTACHVQGAPRIFDAVERNFGICNGETTEDLMFSLESVRCLGCCSLAPAVSVDGKVIRNANSVTINKKIVTKTKEVEEQ